MEAPVIPRWLELCRTAAGPGAQIDADKLELALVFVRDELAALVAPGSEHLPPTPWHNLLHDLMERGEEFNLHRFTDLPGSARGFLVSFARDGESAAELEERHDDWVGRVEGNRERHARARIQAAFRGRYGQMVQADASQDPGVVRAEAEVLARSRAAVEARQAVVQLERERQAQLLPELERRGYLRVELERRLAAEELGRWAEGGAADVTEAVRTARLGEVGETADELRSAVVERLAEEEARLASTARTIWEEAARACPLNDEVAERMVLADRRAIESESELREAVKRAERVRGRVERRLLRGLRHTVTLETL
jgi:hypothetical protein